MAPNPRNPPCKLLSEDDSTLSYPLTLNEWQYCHGELDKSDPEAIVDKAHLLSKRFHNLLEDIVALQTSHTLSDQIDWEMIWEELYTVQPRPTTRIIDDNGLPHGPNSDMNDQRNLGIELGRVVRMLCELGGGSKRMVLKGMIRGLMIDESKRINPDDVQYNMIKQGPFTTLDPVNDRIHPDNEEALEQVCEIVSEIEGQLERQTFLSAQEANHLNKTKQAIQFPSLYIDSALESKSITATSAAQDFVETRMDFDHSILPRSEKKREKRLNQAQEVVEELKSHKDIQTAENLAELISKDMETLRNEKESKGWIIFREIDGAKGSISKATLIERTDVSKTEIGYLLAKLSGNKEPDEIWLRGQQWSDRPVLTEVGNDNWKTTSLGTLIYNVAYKSTSLDPDTELSQKKITEQLHKHILDDEYELPSVDEWLNRVKPNQE